MIQNRQVLKRALLAFIFSGLMIMPGWFVTDERVDLSLLFVGGVRDRFSDSFFLL